MPNVRRGALTAGCLALVAAAVSPAGGLAQAAQEDTTKPHGWVLYRTNEPERFANLRVAICAEPGTSLDTVEVSLDALEPDETPTGAVCTIAAVPSPPTDRDQPSARWVDNPGPVRLKAKPGQEINFASCRVVNSLPLLVDPDHLDVGPDCTKFAVAVPG
ncbi:hypothetical protein AB0M80_41480 [Amycolatopsis sp. NPDC051045]|uniref:hypothetical protein n=1 Tax=Amycolatopsis sp. NPDC051045 TaxID=3156922 RepID=UPI00342F933C